jgi:hypothetical protein
VTARAHFLQIQLLLQRMKHAVMNRSVAMKAQQLAPACRDGRQDNGEVIPSLVD